MDPNQNPQQPLPRNTPAGGQPQNNQPPMPPPLPIVPPNMPVGGVPQAPQPAQPSLPSVPKQQVVESLRTATNVLITVSDNPSIDQLAACIGLTLMMNKLDKHATAVFSGQVPSTLHFLQPERTLETTTNSLRDFIISLDRNKADKLRYKIEDNVVKIFITPYRTSISEADLQYSQGDFNVDVVIALGVSESTHLDQAIAAHGRILHDATIMGISCGQVMTTVGSVNWHDPNASSLCEMLVSISESFRGGLLDAQMATAFLTGIVDETERFSNDKTSPKVMTMSAQLMAAGANQQLISTQLELPPPPPPASVMPSAQQISTMLPPPPPPKKKDDGEFSVPQPGESGKDTSDLISLHESEKATGGLVTELKAPAPAFDQTNAAPGTDQLGQIHIDENGRIIDPSATPPADTKEGPDKQDDQKSDPDKEKTSGEPNKAKDSDHHMAGEPPKTDDQPKDKPDADNGLEDGRLPKPPPLPLMRTHEKVIKPLDKPKTDKPKTDLRHYNFDSPNTTDKNTGGESSAIGDSPQRRNVPLMTHDHPESSVNDNPPAIEPETSLPSMPVVDPPPPAPPADPAVSFTPTAPADEDSARKAVMDAMSAPDYKPVSESPLDALNAPAIPLDAPLANPAVNQNQSPAAPPPVPPPLSMSPPNPNEFTLPTP